MEQIEFEEYLKTRYYNQIEYYEKASAKNQKRYRNFQWILIIFSTLTTILAATKEIAGIDMHYVITVTAAIVTVLSAAIKTFQYQELWVNYRNTIEQLKPEIYYYRFNTGAYSQPGVDREKLFVSRVESILAKEHDAWPILRKMNEGASGDQNQTVSE